MNRLFFLLFLLSFLTGYSQTNKGNALIAQSLLPTQTKRTDSFVFASKAYVIPGDCGREKQSNCCTYLSRPDQLNCNNGTSLVWTYLPSLALANSNMENRVKNGDGNQKSVMKERIKCYLLDTEVSGYVVSSETKENQKWYTLLVTGEVNGKAMLVELHSTFKMTNNTEIQPVIKQIVRFK